VSWIGRLLRCGELEYDPVGAKLRQRGHLEKRPGVHLSVPPAAFYLIMKKEEAIKR
jgi:hypothetical protein